MQGGYQKYPMRPTPDPKQVGQALSGMQFGPAYSGVKGPLAMNPEDRSHSFREPGAAPLAGMPGQVGDFFDPTYEAEEVTPFQKAQPGVGEMRLAGAESETLAPEMTAPVPTVTNQLNSGYLSDSGASSGLLAAIGGALQRVEGGIDHPTDAGRAITAPDRYTQLRRTGMSDEEAQLMMQTGGA